MQALSFIEIGKQCGRGREFVYVDYDPPGDVHAFHTASVHEILAWTSLECGFAMGLDSFYRLLKPEFGCSRKKDYLFFALQKPHEHCRRFCAGRLAFGVDDAVAFALHNPV